MPTLASFSAYVGALSSGNYPFNATTTPVAIDGFNFYSSGSGSLRLNEAATTGPWSINYNGTSLKTEVALVEGQTNVNPTALNAAGGVTRYMSIPYLATSNPVTVTITYTNSSASCSLGQIAIVDKTGKAIKVGSACGTTNQSISATVTDPTNTELFILYTRNTDASGGLRVWQVDVTK